MELTVLSQQGQSAGRTVTLADSVWAIEPHVHAMWHDVKRILANKRQGTHKTKERSEVHGTNKKPYRQKGTGNARQGDVKSPLWRHGGTVFGPRPRDYSMKINRKVSALARRSALSAKVREQNVTVVEAFSVQEPRTKDVVKVLKALKLEGKRVLLVTPAVDKTLYLASRNIPGVSILPASDLNTYDILHAHQLLILDKAVDVVNQQLA